MLVNGLRVAAGQSPSVAALRIARPVRVANRRIGRWQTLANVGAVEQVGALVAYVVDFQSSVLRQFALHRQRPLLHVRIRGNSEMITAKNWLPSIAGVTW